MYETDADLQTLQHLLDQSYARAGAHLRSIWGQETRLDAGALSDYPRELYDFDWDAAHPSAPYARIEAGTMLAFKRAAAAGG